MRNTNNKGKSTQALWAGEEQSLVAGATQVPIVASAAFSYEDLDEWQAVALGQQPGHIYSRNTNPTVRAFEQKLCVLEQAEAAVAFASGMAAISNTLFALLKPHDRVIAAKDSYGGTAQIFTEFLPRFDVQAVLCETTDFAQIEQEIAQGCRVLYLETPTNPTLKIQDIARLSRAAHAVGAVVVVDNTFATPINQQPLALGADLVLHSASKFLGGHADVLGGVLCGNKDLVAQVYHFREITGAALDPHAAYLLLRGLKTLELRIERQNASALRIAGWLAAHPKIEQVFYPGLESHPQHQLASAQMTGGFGGMIAFELRGGWPSVKSLLEKLEFAHRAANLGAVETIVGTPATTSHVEVSREGRAALGIPEALVRYSTGIENPEDLIADLEQALAAVEPS